VDKNREDKEYVFCEIEFDKFWIPYPVYKNRKTGKERCKQWFIEQKISADDVGKMIVTLEKQKPEWAKDGNEYIPKPLTWLNAGDWRDGVEFEVKPKAQVATAQLCKYPGCNDVADYYHPEPRCRKHKK
ncbi:MAG: hypothetical protein GY841_04265, partial [FCB group bacterium]|nr:hypothetical protein [FCB group bacterium]